MSEIEVDSSHGSDTDSESLNSSTTSLSSTLQDYLLENGRRYHIYYGADKNFMPTDEVEQDRLDVHHEMLRLLLDGKLYRAPVDPKELHNILDLGTGTGIWAIDIAELCPQAKVTGLDLSPIQPNWVPPNCQFEVDDIELPWTQPADTADFVHSRNLFQVIGNWPNLLSQVLKTLRPGGYFEIADVEATVRSDDGSLKDADIVHRYFAELERGMSSIGRGFGTAEKIKGMLEEAGFVDVGINKIKQPWGPWPKNKRLKQAGTLCLGTAETGFHAYGMAVFTRYCGMSVADADALCKTAAASLLDRKKHMYNIYFAVWGRKP